MSLEFPFFQAPGHNQRMTNIDHQIATMQEQLSLLHAFIRKLEADGIPLGVGLQAFRDLSKFKGAKQAS
jgi:hypothetical protein